jgi:hypothetical protein
VSAFVKSLLAIGLLLASVTCFAHKQSDSYLTITADGAKLQGQWDIALRDLDFVIGLDANADDRITWGEVKGQTAAIEAYAFDRLRLESIGKANRSVCPISMQQLLIDEHVDGAYAVLRFVANCAMSPERIDVNYDLLFAADPNHRGLLGLHGKAFNQTVVLSRDSRTASLRADAGNPWQQFRSFVGEGVWHIWQGYDHILFLFTLLLPAVVVHREGRWQARASLRDSAGDILKVVTAFTLAHSLTLSLAALGVVSLPSRLVESAIALTVLLGALNILFPLVLERRWLVALIFGLIHGLGFASVLADLGLPSSNLLQALIGFNAGVELGQLAIVVLLMPVTFLIRQTAFYRRLVLPAGATAISCLAVYWIATRAFPAVVPTL